MHAHARRDRRHGHHFSDSVVFGAGKAKHGLGDAPLLASPLRGKTRLSKTLAPDWLQHFCAFVGVTPSCRCDLSKPVFEVKKRVFAKSCWWRRRDSRRLAGGYFFLRCFAVPRRCSGGLSHRVLVNEGKNSIGFLVPLWQRAPQYCPCPRWHGPMPLLAWRVSCRRHRHSLPPGPNPYRKLRLNFTKITKTHPKSRNPPKRMEFHENHDRTRTSP